MKRFKDWLARFLLRTYFRLRPRRDARFVVQTYAVAMPDDDTPFVIDPATGEKVLAPEGCSWHMAIRPGTGVVQLALSVDDPAFRAVLVYGEVGIMRPTPSGVN